MKIELENHIKIDTNKKDAMFIQDGGKIHIKEKSELAEAMEELNKDVAEDQSGMTGIDLRANLHFTEISSLLALDTLSRMAFLPPEVNWLTRQKKRLSVSKGGLGRMQIVQLATGNAQNKNIANGLIGVMAHNAQEENKAKTNQ